MKAAAFFIYRLNSIDLVSRNSGIGNVQSIRSREKDVFRISLEKDREREVDETVHR